MGEKGSEGTQGVIDAVVPEGKEGKSFSESKKGEHPMGIASSATDIFGALGSGISNIFGFVKVAQLIKKKPTI